MVAAQMVTAQLVAAEVVAAPLLDQLSFKIQTVLLARNLPHPNGSSFPKMATANALIVPT